jgi:hypothetical protein
MKKNKLMLLIIFSLFLSSVSQMAVAVNPSSPLITETMQITDEQMQAGTGWGPGGSMPLMCPQTLGYVYPTGTKEPATVTWTVYNPNFVEVIKLVHAPSTKGQDGATWYFADKTVFVVPAFAKKGDWIAGCEVTFTDGSKGTITFGANGEFLFIGLPVTEDGDIITNLFVAPWYLMGMMMPAYFWFPGCLLWIPALFIIISAIYVKSIGGFVLVLRGIRESTRGARSKWK